MPDANRRHPNVVHLTEVEPRTVSAGTRFAFTTRWFTRATGARGVGCSWFEVPPGKTAFPAHYHCANEESAYVLEGEATLRIGDRTVPIRAGDYVTFPVGPEAVHEIVNTGTTPLRYLAFSTLLPTEVVGYPDSRKIGTTATARFGEQPWIRGLFREGSSVDYYDGEKMEP
ncbi:cupin domain-containing protein [Anaeromyxobacter oryzae]|uniref:Cupin type-2 domain-containing protein n=1 Tax=Anaeromyxobacter oryzae TaxID=2918170 RepID=A0ABM7X4C6_9BACT|nr:cupin domain-containing protein [Anaeromyxobacter oryzae]BDG06642.1 hypothetical protein AMOR_56380 [Anaeromyxobacter oryzae]